LVLPPAEFRSGGTDVHVARPRLDRLIVAPDSSNYIGRFFCHITDPFVALVAPLTPKAGAPVVIWLFCVAWLF
jgi:hypothetical protein